MKKCILKGRELIKAVLIVSGYLAAGEVLEIVYKSPDKDVFRLSFNQNNRRSVLTVKSKPDHQWAFEALAE